MLQHLYQPFWPAAQRRQHVLQELEESQQKTVFEDLCACCVLVASSSSGCLVSWTWLQDFQFVTKDQLEQLGASELVPKLAVMLLSYCMSLASLFAGRLVGTKYLQPYMHGFFMD